MDDGAALEEFFEQSPVTANWTIGFLSGVCTGPDAVASSEWIPVVITDGAFDEDPAARAKVDLLARLFGAVSETLRASPEIIAPRDGQARRGGRRLLPRLPPRRADARDVA